MTTTTWPVLKEMIVMKRWFVWRVQRSIRYFILIFPNFPGISAPVPNHAPSILPLQKIAMITIIPRWSNMIFVISVQEHNHHFILGLHFSNWNWRKKKKRKKKKKERNFFATSSILSTSPSSLPFPQDTGASCSPPHCEHSTTALTVIPVLHVTRHSSQNHTCQFIQTLSSTHTPVKLQGQWW